MAFSSEKGRNWLLKALDPSMTSIDVDGVPDMAVDNVIMLKYNSQFQVSAPSYIQVNETWNADIYLFPHPVLFGTVIKYGSRWNPYDQVTYNATETFTPTGGTTITGIFNMADNSVTGPNATEVERVTMVERMNLLNTQIADANVSGSSYQKKCKTLCDNVDGVRIAYGSVTLIPNVSSLYDSGVLVATQQSFHTGQFDLNPTMLDYDNASGNPSYGTAGIVGLNTDTATICACDDNDFPTFENAVNNPQMLSTRFKNGVYMPYKIMNPQVHPFRALSKKSFFATRGILTGVEYVKPSNTESTKKAKSVYYEPLIDQGVDNLTNWFTSGLSTSAQYDNFLDVSKGKARICDLSYTQMHDTSYGSGIPMVGSNVMCICLRGLAQQATFSLVFRVGFEARVSAGTNYSMFKYVSPNYDEQALRSYQNVVRQSKDAYVGDLENSPRLRQALSALIGIEPNTDVNADMPGFVGSIGV